MNAQHTPGPWNDLGMMFGFGYVLKHSNEEKIAYIAAYDLDEDCAEPYGTWGKEADANRLLVLAAPDLLAVLQELQESAAYWSEYDVPLGIVERINQAITKATGVAA